MAIEPPAHTRELAAFAALTAHYDEIAGVHLRDLFASDPPAGTA